MFNTTWTDGKIRWKRLPIPPEDMKRFTARSNFKGLLQSLSFLGLFVLTGGTAYIAYIQKSWVLMSIALYLHGTFYPFAPFFAIHELTHNTVFRSKYLNNIMIWIYGLFAWVMNPYSFRLSHRRHHFYTLHCKHDGEEPRSRRFSWKDPTLWLSFFRFFYIKNCFIHISRLLLIRPQGIGCNGPRFSEWENYVMREKGAPKDWQAAKTWALVCLLFHFLFSIWAIWSGNWFLIVVVTLSPFYGGYWYASLIGTHMHTAVEDNVGDWRKCCRSVKLDPFSSFLYWHMENHIEHHMFAAVPCYNLKRFSKYIHKNFAESFPKPLGFWKNLNYCSKHPTSSDSSAGPRLNLP